MKSNKLRTLAIVAGSAAALVTAYAGLGFFAVPAIVASQAEKMAQQQFKRKLTIDQVAFNPFKLTASLRGVKLMEPDGSAVFVSFDAFDADVSWQSLRNLAPVVEKVRLQAPYVHLVRGDNGKYSIDDILQWMAAQPPSKDPALFSVNNIELANGRIAFEDKPARARHMVEGLQLGLPFISSMPADVNVYVQPLLSATIDGAPLHIQGKAKPYAEQREYAMEFRLDKLDLPQLLGYLPFQPAFKLPSARLDARLTMNFVQPKAGNSSLALGGEAALSNVEVRGGDGAPVLKFARLSAQLDKLDLVAGKYAIAKIGLDGLDASLLRDAAGQLNVNRLLPPPAAAPAAAASKKTATSTMVAVKAIEIRNAALRYADAAPYSALKAGVQRFDLDVRDLAVDTGKRTVTVAEAVSASAAVAYAQGARTGQAPVAAPVKDDGKPYHVQVGKMDVRGWSIDVDDASRGQPLKLALSPLQLTVKDWSNAPASRSDIDLQTTINRSGKLGISGSLASAPLDADLALDLKNLDLQPLQTLIAEHVNLRVAQAAVSAQGRVKLADDGGVMKGGYKGDASVDRLSTVDRLNDADFLSWKSLAFGGMDVQLAPFAMNIDKVALSDFFARVIIDPNGRINVQDVMRTAANEDRSLTDAKNRAQDAKASAQRDGKGGRQVVAQATAPMPPVRIGQLQLSGGRVRFTDNFIKPNYTANLKDLGGAVSGLNSDPAQPANVDLKGSVNSAPLSIAGKVHPLRKDLFLDLKADVRGMELAALSAYADKYVGYGIEKGKLSFEVAYKLDERKLTAENRLILDQLTFGNESTNPEATKLPVRLAVALLSDRNGVIDINVPIGGSLDDPQFSMGGIIMKVIGNAVMKTVTAPFTFIASLFGGNGEEMAALAFDAGHANVAAEREEKLAPLAKALNERPGLKLDIGGRYDPTVDMGALRQLALERKLRTVKQRELQAKNKMPAEGGVTVTAEERPALLARAYAAEPLQKPRNALGMQKAVPPAEMEQAMLAAIEIDDDDLTALAHKRAQAAKDWLIRHGVPAERLFLTAAKEGACKAEFTLR
ncbi:hypothetical protein GCM10027277_34700 [Pseudoduganella ginsengisoli]|uniref:DUF748 domain-containing protein n=1 Tax=Pseudoduganella ginsengisoli TaxID=1462440 RepID=A0A6L6PY49_9BURK|nr:DUF748 domain-containing protein [Pseudoduganella ginsengisoli]MTW02094.1 DUF748 domain-containing protein [Pseudoduganella ginsengisoli]